MIDWERCLFPLTPNLATKAYITRWKFFRGTATRYRFRLKLHRVTRSVLWNFFMKCFSCHVTWCNRIVKFPRTSFTKKFHRVVTFKFIKPETPSRKNNFYLILTIFGTPREVEMRNKKYCFSLQLLWTSKKCWYPKVNELVSAGS